MWSIHAKSKIFMMIWLLSLSVSVWYCVQVSSLMLMVLALYCYRAADSSACLPACGYHGKEMPCAMLNLYKMQKQCAFGALRLVGT